MGEGREAPASAGAAGVDGSASELNASGASGRRLHNLLVPGSCLGSLSATAQGRAAAEGRWDGVEGGVQGGEVGTGLKGSRASRKRRWSTALLEGVVTALYDRAGGTEGQTQGGSDGAEGGVRVCPRCGAEPREDVIEVEGGGEGEAQDLVRVLGTAFQEGSELKSVAEIVGGNEEAERQLRGAAAGTPTLQAPLVVTASASVSRHPELRLRLPPSLMPSSSTSLAYVDFALSQRPAAGATAAAVTTQPTAVTAGACTAPPTSTSHQEPVSAVSATAVAPAIPGQQADASRKEAAGAVRPDTELSARLASGPSRSLRRRYPAGYKSGRAEGELAAAAAPDATPSLSPAPRTTRADASEDAGDVRPEPHHHARAAPPGDVAAAAASRMASRDRSSPQATVSEAAAEASRGRVTRGRSLAIMMQQLGGWSVLVAGERDSLSDGCDVGGRMGGSLEGSSRELHGWQGEEEDAYGVEMEMESRGGGDSYDAPLAFAPACKRRRTMRRRTSVASAGRSVGSTDAQGLAVTSASDGEGRLDLSGGVTGVATTMACTAVHGKRTPRRNAGQHGGFGSFVLLPV